MYKFPPQRPVTRSFGVFFDLRQNKRLSKQSKPEQNDRYVTDSILKCIFLNIKCCISTKIIATNGPIDNKWTLD